MNLLSKSILVVVALFGLYSVAQIVFGVTSTAPMIVMPLKVTQNGKLLPKEEISDVQYYFNVSSSVSNENHSPAELLKAEERYNSYWLNAPFTICKRGLSVPVITPQYDSVFIRITIRNEQTISIRFPVSSTRNMNGPIEVDLSACSTRK